MNTTAIATIVRKEWAEMYRNSLVLSTVIFMPLLFTALPLVILGVGSGFDSGSEALLSELPPQMASLCAGLTSGQCGQIYIVSQFMLMFMLIPVMIPATITPYSIVGEKTQRSLEPLLATPISTAELLTGKNLAAILPGVIATWLAFALFAVGARLLLASSLAFSRLFDARWLIAIFLLGPLLAVFANALAIMVSSRSNDPRVAQQVSSLLVFPVIMLFLGQMIGWIVFDTSFALILCLVFLILDIALTYLAVRIFDRETILTRWA
ncbi:MAG: ABC transporter permease [Caldilineales bacterium]|nr:ABC transporter permease [Caldilineales bacterium]